MYCAKNGVIKPARRDYCSRFSIARSNPTERCLSMRQFVRCFEPDEKTEAPKIWHQLGRFLAVALGWHKSLQAVSLGPFCRYRALRE